MLGGASGVVVGGGLVAALLMKGADGTLRPSLNRTSTELLFLPIPDHLRSRVKPAIDVIGQRGGQAVASVFILSQLALGRGDSILAVFVVVLCVAWIAAIADLRPHYVEMFRRALREGIIETRGGLPELDLVSLETLFAALNSRDDHEVIAALDLLHAEDRVHLVPALVLYHPTPAGRPPRPGAVRGRGTHRLHAGRRSPPRPPRRRGAGGRPARPRDGGAGRGAAAARPRRPQPPGAGDGPRRVSWPGRPRRRRPGPSWR